MFAEVYKVSLLRENVEPVSRSAKEKSKLATYVYDEGPQEGGGGPGDLEPHQQASQK